MSLQLQGSGSIGYHFPIPRQTWIQLSISYAVGLLLVVGWSNLWFFVIEANWDAQFPDGEQTWGLVIMVVILGAMIFFWSFQDSAHQKRRVEKFMTIMNNYFSFSDLVFNYSTDTAEDFIRVSTDAGLLPERNISCANLVLEVIGMILLAQILLLWQFTSRTRDPREAYSLAEFLGDTEKYTGNVPTILKNEMATEREAYISVAMMNVIKKRIQTFSASPEEMKSISMRPSYSEVNVFYNRFALLNSARTIVDMTYEAIVVEETTPWYWAFVMSKIFAVVYFLGLPFALYGTLGWYMILFNTVLYLVVGLVVVYSIVLSNVFQNPSSMTEVIYKRCLDHEKSCAAKIIDKYPQMFNTRDKRDIFQVVSGCIRLNSSSRKSD